MNHWVDEGKVFLRQGQREQAERAFRIGIQEDPRDLEGYLWLAEVTQSDAERQTLLLKILEIDPRNATARQKLGALQQHNLQTEMPRVNPFDTTTADTDPSPSQTDPIIITSGPQFSSLPDMSPDVVERGVGRRHLSIVAGLIFMLLIAVVIVVAIVLSSI